MTTDTGREALRRLMLARRDNTSDNMLGLASEKICRRLQRWSLLRDAESVGAYFSVGSEIRTTDIMQDVLISGRKLLLPAVAGDLMEFRAIHGEKDLVPGPFGIWQPRERCPSSIPDVALVPAVAVTPHGDRLGYGGGYYDRYLESHSIESAALSLEKQVIKRIPPRAGDVSVDWVVTEERLHQI